MSEPTLRQRFRQNPWPYWVGVLILTLTLMWVRERRIIQEEMSLIREKLTSPRPRPAGFSQSQLMLFAGPPQLVDPFGNTYYLSTKSNPGAFLTSAAASKFRLCLYTSNLDRSIGTILAFDDVEGFTFKPAGSKTDWVLPAVFCGLLLTFVFLSFHNARRRNHPQS